MTGAAADGGLDDLLRGVSRSFYLSLRVLPAEVRPQISLAYLLARASDTVADTRVVPRQRRLGLLARMREGDFAAVAGLAQDQALPAERALLERLGECGRRLEAMPEPDRGLVRRLLDTIISGQLFDLERFPGEGPAEAAALADDAELDRYAYLVAGCVGEFWTRLCAARLPEFKALDAEEMTRLGVRFGKGLQLVNILRDMAGDLRIGRCYLPVKDPRALLHPSAFEAIRPLYHRWLDEALSHLEAAWRYSLMAPASRPRLRLACVWPVWIGLETLALLRRANPLDPARRAVVAQWRVNLLLAASILFVWSDSLLDAVFRRLTARAARPSAA